jgi:hypothetical protein
MMIQQQNKINEGHLNRKAIIYVRQSTDRQVKKNTESQRLQYSLQDKAREWGWNDIEIIDSDLGSSAAVGASERRGFERITSLVAVGEAGIIFSREASRLSRTDKDWCRLGNRKKIIPPNWRSNSMGYLLPIFRCQAFFQSLFLFVSLLSGLI